MILYAKFCASKSQPHALSNHIDTQYQKKRHGLTMPSEQLLKSEILSALDFSSMIKPSYVAQRLFDSAYATVSLMSYMV